jgi:guanylate kinase
MSKEHVLLCILGRTASGKDSLVNKLCEKTGFTQIISYTTRARRDNEGETHRFVTKQVYDTMLASGEVAVDTNIDGNYYWATIEQLYENDVYILDYIGLKKLKSLNLPGLRLVSVFINTPDEIRKARALEKRGDDRGKFLSRDFDEKTQFREMLKKADFDYAVSNIEFINATSVLRWISTVEGVWTNHKEDATE